MCEDCQLDGFVSQEQFVGQSGCLPVTVRDQQFSNIELLADYIKRIGARIVARGTGTVIHPADGSVICYPFDTLALDECGGASLSSGRLVGVDGLYSGSIDITTNIPSNNTACAVGYFTFNGVGGTSQSSPIEVNCGSLSFPISGIPITPTDTLEICIEGNGDPFEITFGSIRLVNVGGFATC